MLHVGSQVLGQNVAPCHLGTFGGDTLALAKRMNGLLHSVLQGWREGWVAGSPQGWFSRKTEV